MSKKKKKSIEEGKELTIDVDFALSRAASMLIYAGEAAIDSGNTKHILKVASAWADFSSVLVDGPDDEKKQGTTSGGFGFSHMELAGHSDYEEYEEDEEEYEDE